jgi:DNA-directed RNA polymerase subunit K/omega
MNFKNTNAARTTITRSFQDLERETNNIYETIVILSKRANQISVAIKEELTQKLTEFASHTDNLEEIFENKEQIEISRFYERLPKPNAYAIEEWENDGTYYREKVIKEEE